MGPKGELEEVKGDESDEREECQVVIGDDTILIMKDTKWNAP